MFDAGTYRTIKGIRQQYYFIILSLISYINKAQSPQLAATGLPLEGMSMLLAGLLRSGQGFDCALGDRSGGFGVSGRATYAQCRLESLRFEREGNLLRLPKHPMRADGQLGAVLRDAFTSDGRATGEKTNGYCQSSRLENYRKVREFDSFPNP